MALKPRTIPTSSEPLLSQPDLWSGPWGRINPTASGSDVVRFCWPGGNKLPEQTHSFPYRVLSSWQWTNHGSEEELKIEASSYFVTVRGRRLDRIVEALDHGALEILRECPAETLPDDENTVWVATITVEETATLNLRA